MKADGLFVITCIVFIFAAWVATGGPARPISQAGPFITPITRPGEASQGYRYIVPTNPLNAGSYPRQVGGAPSTISSGAPDASSQSGNGAGSDRRNDIGLEHSSLGPASGNPNQEYVTLVNYGAATVDVRDWRIESKATRTSIGASLHALHAGETLHLVSGRGDTESLFHKDLCEETGSICIYLNRNLEVFARSHETITLYDDTGSVVDSFSY
jgi:hypothetical protein